MKKNAFVFAGILAAALITGCSDNGNGSTSTSGSSGGSSGASSTSTSGSGSASGSSGSGSATGSGSGSGSSGSTTNPAPPALGAQIDRMGRPAINTALTNPFNLDGNQDADKDAYNASSDPTTWTASFAPEIAGNLAILDGLDAVCGNQAFSTLADGGFNDAATRYETLAGVLADDRLWVNTASGTCTTYLAAEANATGLLGNSDCGGRTPAEDVIDESYSLLATGGISGVSDGVGADSDGTVDVSTASFPFLAAPN